MYGSQPLGKADRSGALCKEPAIMTESRFTAERAIAVPAEQVYRCIADYRQHHPHFLPDAFSDLVVEQGGVGAGTIIRFRLKAAGRTRSFHQRVDEPQPGRVLTETGIEDNGVTTFTVTPEGDGSRVRIDTTWQSTGIRGFFERLIAPRVLRPLYTDELERLERYAGSLEKA
jgi:uncharacterized protein YndB with AHSA1/START domain